MAIVEQIAPDGMWKVRVEAFTVGLVVYNALGIKTKVFAKTLPTFWARLFGAKQSWVSIPADQVTASGSLGSSNFPGVFSPIPGSPKTNHNASEADTRGWWIGVGIKIGGGSFSPKPGPEPIADRVTGSGSAARGGVVVSAGPVSAP